MSDTPETDASVFDAEANGIIYKCVFAAFASQLERERNSLQDQRDFCMGEIERLKRKINEAVECKISAIESWDEERKRAIREGERVVKEREKYFAMRALSNNATELAEKYKQERDEAREMLRRIMDWSPCLPEYEPDAQHLKWQADAHAARKFLEGAK